MFSQIIKIPATPGTNVASKILYGMGFLGSIRTVARGDTGLQKGSRNSVAMFSISFLNVKSPILFFIWKSSYLWSNLYEISLLLIFTPFCIDRYFFLILNETFHNFINLSSLRQKHVQLHPRGVQKSHKFKMSITDEIFNENK